MACRKRIVVIGGSAAGPKAAAKARRMQRIFVGRACLPDIL